MEPQVSLPVHKTRLLVLIMNHIDIFHILWPCFFQDYSESYPFIWTCLAFLPGVLYVFINAISVWGWPPVSFRDLDASCITGAHLTFTLYECGAWMLQHACSHVSLGFMLLLCLSSDDCWSEVKEERKMEIKKWNRADEKDDGNTN